ncbi:hypothetical protein [Crucivirus-438]|nr:hypothetical protein [Crucivirus-438]
MACANHLKMLEPANEAAVRRLGLIWNSWFNALPFDERMDQVDVYGVFFRDQPKALLQNVYEAWIQDRQEMANAWIAVTYNAGLPRALLYQNNAMYFAFIEAMAPIAPARISVNGVLAPTKGFGRHWGGQRPPYGWD